MGTVEHFK